MDTVFTTDNPISIRNSRFQNDTNFRSAFAESQTERPQSLVGLLKLPPSPQDDMCKGLFVHLFYFAISATMSPCSKAPELNKHQADAQTKVSSNAGLSYGPWPLS